MKIKNTNDRREKGIQVREISDLDFPEKQDRIFEISVDGIFRGENVRMAVERVIQWAFEVVQWQRIAGLEPGCMPSFQSYNSDDIGSVEPVLADGGDKASSNSEKRNAMMRAHGTFCAMVELHICSFEGRWMGAMCNNITAMDLGEDHPEVASILNLALEKSCVVSRFQWEPDRTTQQMPESFFVTKLSNSSSSGKIGRDTEKQEKDDALTREKELEAFLTPRDAPVLKQSFWKGVSHRGRFDQKAQIYAQINLISVSVQRDMRGSGESTEIESGESNDADSKGQESTGNIFGINRQGRVNAHEFGGSDDSEDSVELEPGTDELLLAKGATRWLSRKVLNAVHLERGETGCAVVLIPRLFSHEEFSGSSGISMQYLNDLPLCVARAIELKSDEAQLITTVCKHLCIGRLEDAPVDTTLVACARMHYLVSIVYRQIENKENLSDYKQPFNPIQFMALNDCDVWPNGLSEHHVQMLGDGMNEICSAVTSSDVVLVPKDIDSFFTGLRDGIRRQRAQVFLECITEILDGKKNTPESCYFDIRKDPTVPGFIFSISDGWFKYIGEAPWNHLVFDSSFLQYEHLLMLAKVIGFRKKSDIFMIEDAGRA